MSNKDLCASSCDRAVSDRNDARIVWVDVARGVAMLAILLFHTEMRYAEWDIIPYSMYVENFLALFFFVSGYLFVSPKRQFTLRGKLVSIAKRLVVPYVLFVSLMAVKGLCPWRRLDIVVVYWRTGVRQGFVVCVGSHCSVAILCVG